MLLGHGSEFSVVALPCSTFAGAPHPFSLFYPALPLSHYTTGYHRSDPTAPPVRLFLFRGCEHDATHEVQSSPEVGLHSAALSLSLSPPAYTYIYRTLSAGGSEPR